MTSHLWIALLAVGCGGGGSDSDADDTPTPTDTPTDVPTGETGTTDPTVTGPVTVACAVMPDNALRVGCDVDLDTAGDVEITFQPAAGGGPTRSVTSVGSDTEHTLVLWRMRAETTYDYTVTAPGGTVTGSFTTGALPALADVTVAVTGASTATEDVLFQKTCDGPAAVVVDPEGHPVWYQDLAVGLPAGTHSVEALHAAESGGVIAIVDNERVRWFDPDGTLRLDFEAPIPAHHDLFERDGLVFVVTADVYDIGGEDYVLDGVLVIDEAGAIRAAVQLRDIVTPTGSSGGSDTYWAGFFPGAHDWSHVNGLYVDEALSVYLSMFKHNTIVKIAADPSGADVGELQWVLEGTPGSAPWTPDYVVTDPDALTLADRFSGQHHPHLTSQGRLMLYDNAGAANGSRALELDLDEGSGEARITGVWSLGKSCPIHGAAYELANGNVLATCMADLTFYELDRATAQVVRELTPTCAGGDPPGLVILPRGIPITL